jgi:hypothetical protein
MTRRSLLPALFLALAVMAAAPASAQDAALPSTTPGACTIEPRTQFPTGEEGDLTALSPTPTPAIDETGAAPADQAAIDAVTATVAMSIACQNAGDLPRMLATFSDAWIEGRFDSYDLVYLDTFQRNTALAATPVADADRRDLVAVTDVVVLPDGAIVATVVTSAGGVEERARLRFVTERDALVIDEATPLA